MREEQVHQGEDDMMIHSVNRVELQEDIRHNREGSIREPTIGILSYILQLYVELVCPILFQFNSFMNDLYRPSQPTPNPPKFWLKGS